MMDGPLNLRMTSKGWLAAVDMMAADGHDVDDCQCSRCQKIRSQVLRIYNEPCQKCGGKTPEQFLFDTDYLHCRRCHLDCLIFGRNCLEVGAPAG